MFTVLHRSLSCVRGTASFTVFICEKNTGLSSSLYTYCVRCNYYAISISQSNVNLAAALFDRESSVVWPANFGLVTLHSNKFGKCPHQ